MVSFIFLQVKIVIMYMTNYLYSAQFDQISEPYFYIIILHSERYRMHNSSPNLHLVKLRLSDFPKFMLM